MKEEERFWSKVDIGTPEECWNWKGRPDSSGYGRFCFAGNIIRASRYAYELMNGHPPIDKPWILHHCDNRKCVNPKHLYAGTVQDNNNDCKRRDRHNRGKYSTPWTWGEKCNLSKLTETEVFQIRELCRSRAMFQKDIAKAYGITRQTVTLINNRRRWTHIS